MHPMNVAENVGTAHDSWRGLSRGVRRAATLRGGIWLAFAAVSLITVSLGAYSRYGIDQAEKLVEVTYDESLMAISYARAASADLSSMRASYARRALTSGAQALNNLDADIALMDKSLNDDLAIAAQRSQSPRAADAAQKAIRAARAWREEEILAKDAPFNAAAWSAVDSHASEANRQIERLIDYVAGDGFLYRESASAIIRHYRLFTLAGTGAALLLSILIAYYLTRRIVGSVSSALIFAESIAGGNLSGELPARNADELGALITSMGVMRDKLRMMMQREMAERRHAQARLADALESSKAGIVMIDVNGEIAIANSQAASFFSDSVGEPLTGLNFSKLSGSLASAIRNSGDLAVETRLPDGRWLRVSRSVGREGGIVAICADVSELKLQEERLKETNRSLDVALDNMSQGLCMYDPNLRLRVVNKRFCEIFKIRAPAIDSDIDHGRMILLSQAAGAMTDSMANELTKFFGADALGESGSSGDYANRVIDMSDGKNILVVRRRLSDGGWVATFEDVTESKRSQDRAVFLAQHDALTGLPNRSMLAVRGETALARLEPDAIVAIFCLDLDRFKEVNDTLGHPSGDELLRQVAARLRTCIRESDSLCRIGGDEFAILQASLIDSGDALSSAERMASCLRAPFDLNGRHVSIGASVGIALAPEHGSGFEALLKKADAALYVAKSQGKGNWCLYNTEIDERLNSRRVMESELKDALETGQFELAYQPICDLRTGSICGFEALLRWNHPTHGRVPPTEFIGLCEESGLIVEIGEWVLNTACKEAKNWPVNTKVAVNVSTVQFRDELFVDKIRSALESSQLEPGRLELEITESVLLSDGGNVLGMLRAIREIGAKISLDDFGTGYSSLSYLHKIPFSKVKIDQSFIRDLELVGGPKTIVRTIINLCAGMEVCVTAEGIETIEQLNWLVDAQCNEAQGYLISPPLSASEIRGPVMLRIAQNSALSVAAANRASFGLGSRDARLGAVA